MELILGLHLIHRNPEKKIYKAEQGNTKINIEYSLQNMNQNMILSNDGKQKIRNLHESLKFKMIWYN